LMKQRLKKLVNVPKTGLRKNFLTKN